MSAEPLYLTIVPSAAALEGASLAGRVVAVIDVLRCTSVVVRALSAGAERVICVPRVSEALAFREHATDDRTLLGGERHSDLIPGFDLGNSPLDYTPARVAGRTVVMTTTNGTQVVRLARAARHVVAAALVNAVSAATHLASLAASERRGIVLACAGNTPLPALEDYACAALMAKHIETLTPVTYTDDQSLATRLMADSGDLLGHVRRSQHCRELLQKGYGADVEWCLQRPDCESLVPELHGAAFERP